MDLCRWQFFGVPGRPRRRDWLDPPRKLVGNAAQERHGGYLGLGSRRVRCPFFLARRTDEAGRTSPKRTGGRTPLATGITDWMTAVCLLCLSTNQEAVGG